ncbi:MAG: hypothetical protein KJN82_05360 [Bacteroidia bacterium]|nr:hypothetical protein [Bacteroidia bacterium]
MADKIGIWIDKRVAKVYALEGKDEFLTIQSNIEEYRPKGGSGSKFKGGPQDVVQDSKYLERNKQQYKAYFKDIAESIKDAKNIVIFGPAQTGDKLNKELSRSYPKLHKKVSSVNKADSMTDNQIKALIRDYFNK